MFTKYVLAIPKHVLNMFYYSRLKFSLQLEKITGHISGTMCAKCLLTVPLTTVDGEFSINLKKFPGHLRITMYTKCVLTAPLTTIDPDFAIKY